MPVPEIITERLLLRPLEEPDVEAVFALRTDPEVNRYLDRDPPASREEALAFIRKLRAGDAYYWGICGLEADRVIGTICLWNFSEDGRSAEIGFELSPAFQGKGLMKEALASIIRYAFEDLALAELRGIVHRMNESSIRLLKKNGFSFAAERDNDIWGHDCYILVQRKDPLRSNAFQRE